MERTKTRRRGEGTGRIRGRRLRGESLRANSLFETGFGPAWPSKGGAAEAADSDGRLSATGGSDRLEETLLTAWAALAAGHPIACPVCDGVMTAEGCEECGSKLS